MECVKLLNIIGISLNIIGFILILVYGLPTKYIDTRYKRETPENFFEDRNIPREIYRGHRDNYNKGIKYLGSLGIILNIIGLLLQIWSNFL
jgi:hypothetical protein